MIYIIGAGIAGLSCAFHLKGKPFKIIEKNDRVGGLCRTIRSDGFLFDYSGHLLTMRKGYTKRLMKRLIPEGLVRHSRKAAVYSHGRLIPFPYQAHLGWLPKQVARECLEGFIWTFLEGRAHKHGPRDFQSWILGNFGHGIARHFLLPYHRKFWRIGLEALSAEGVSWSVPRPSLSEVLRGALGIENRGAGYSAVFYYPKKGGIERICKGFSDMLNDIDLGREVESINLKKREISFKGGGTVQYSVVVNSMPLPELISRIEDAPQRLLSAVRELKHVSVMVLNLGVARAAISPYHWIYFPQDEIPFYRVGFYSNFSNQMVPEGCSSLYVEIAHTPQDDPDERRLMDEALGCLMRLGLIKDEKEVRVSETLDIGYAYVVHDEHRRRTLPAVMKFLAENRIYCIGRYGRWRYCTMEDAIMDGKKAAEIISTAG